MMDYYEQILREFTIQSAMEAGIRKAFSDKVNFQKVPGGSDHSTLGLICLTADSPKSMESLADNFVDLVKAISGDRKILFCDDLPRVLGKMVNGEFHTIAFMRGNWR